MRPQGIMCVRHTRHAEVDGPMTTSDADVGDRSGGSSGICQVGGPATDRRRLDAFVIKGFPWFLALCLLFILLMFVLMRPRTFAETLYCVCLGFVFGFCILGFICLFMMDKGRISPVFNIAIMASVPLIIGLFLFEMGDNFYPSLFMIRFFNIFGDTVTRLSVVIAIYSLFIAVYLVSIGVIAVVVGYFRSHIHRIFRYIAKAKDDDTPKKRFVYRFFSIPDIIDVEGVGLDPEPDADAFDKSAFVSIFVSLFTLGVVLCSYMFLNPMFLSEVPYDEMLIISIMLSLFISALVIPWIILKSVGAHVISEARPYYLWKGMRNRLYQGFFAVTLFMMILIMSAYLGMDFSRIAMTYLGYVLFMGLIAGITSFVYMNHFHEGFKNGIVVRFREPRR